MVDRKRKGHTIQASWKARRSRPAHHGIPPLWVYVGVRRCICVSEEQCTGWYHRILGQEGGWFRLPLYQPRVPKHILDGRTCRGVFAEHRRDQLDAAIGQHLRYMG